jgi:hypothetical protein
MELAVRRRGPEGNTSISARKRFGKYKQEGQKRTTMPELLEDEAVKKIFEIFRETRDKVSSGWDIYGTTYYVMGDHGITCCSSDVEKFSLAMGELNDFKSFPSAAGFFLSSIINCGHDDYYKVHTNHLPPLNFFGFKFVGKTVTVNGHLGNYVGTEMNRPSDSMGVIIVNGDVGHYLGDIMDGGEIHVNGNIKGLGSPNYGKIFHNGKLIFSK